MRTDFSGGTKRCRHNHKVTVHDRQHLPNIFRVIRSWSRRLADHVEGMGTEMHRGYWWGSLRERGVLEDLRVDAKIILKYI